MNLSQLKQAVKTAPQELPNAFGQAKKPATLSKANTSSDICTEISQSLPVIRFLYRMFTNCYLSACHLSSATSIFGAFQAIKLIIILLWNGSCESMFYQNKSQKLNALPEAKAV